MKFRSFYFILIVIISLCACTDNKDAGYVEGLLYLDGEAVRIEIVDGYITQIKPLRSGTSLPEVYVAPGLIDIQVNGYMGVDFSDQESLYDNYLQNLKNQFETKKASTIDKFILALKNNLSYHGFIFFL